MKLRREQICDLDSKLVEYTTLFNQFYLKEHARKVQSAKIEIKKEADPILISNELQQRLDFHLRDKKQEVENEIPETSVPNFSKIFDKPFAFYGGYVSLVTLEKGQFAQNDLVSHYRALATKLQLAYDTLASQVKVLLDIKDECDTKLYMFKKKNEELRKKAQELEGINADLVKSNKA